MAEKTGTTERLEQILVFFLEAEKLKAVERKTCPVGISRKENPGEHSWSLILLAVLLQEFADEPLDMLKILKMLAIHDIPEVVSGDVFVYDQTDAHCEAEERGAVEIFSLLPENMQEDLLGLWQEFEKGITPEARFAKALDRFQPYLCNLNNGGGSWLEFGISLQAMLRRNADVRKGSRALWDYLESTARIANEDGLFAKGSDVKIHG